MCWRKNYGKRCDQMCWRKYYGKRCDQICWRKNFGKSCDQEKLSREMSELPEVTFKDSRTPQQQLLESTPTIFLRVLFYTGR